MTPSEELKALRAYHEKILRDLKAYLDTRDAGAGNRLWVIANKVLPEAAMGCPHPECCICCGCKLRRS